jgi:hypothetical protein
VGTGSALANETERATDAEGSHAIVETSLTMVASRRSILFGLAAGVVASPAVASSLLPAVTAPAAETVLSGLAPAVAATSEVDPIFAVLAEHILEHHQADPAAERAASWGVEAAIRAVLTTQPTTIEGVAALLHHVGQHECLGMDREYEDRETVLTA